MRFAYYRWPSVSFIYLFYLFFSLRQIVAYYIGVNQSFEYVPGMSIHWAGGRTNPPPDTPACGFDNSLCKSNNNISRRPYPFSLTYTRDAAETIDRSLFYLFPPSGSDESTAAVYSPRSPRSTITIRYFFDHCCFYRYERSDGTERVH